MSRMIDRGSQPGMGNLPKLKSTLKDEQKKERKARKKAKSTPVATSG